MAGDLSPEQGLELLASTDNINGQSFDLLRLVASLANSERTQNAARDLLIRTLDRRQELEPATVPILETLTSNLGLFPYVVNSSDLNSAEQIALEYHRPPAPRTGDFVFHAMQRAIYDRLLSGESLMLSAPTSFGKSAVVDALVVSSAWSTIVVIVPTLALIDETRRRLTGLRSGYKIVTHPSQSANERTIYIMTQERFLDLPTMPDVKLFIIDEFYKLDAAPGDVRNVQLNIAWDRLRRTGAQYYLIGPNIDGLAETLPATLRDRLVVTDFRTVAVNQQAVESGEDRSDALIELCRNLTGPTLIYVSSPNRAREVGAALLEAGLGRIDASTTDAADWISANYDPSWILGRCLRQGIGLHHGRVPRALQHHILRHFNRGEVSFLVCTSTLIEGVNTVARNVIVYDKTLNNRNLDHFTFNNIRGRAGRMFNHFVGQVFLFAEPPERQDNIVDIPISSQSKRLSNSALLELPRDELSEDSRSRLSEYERQATLSMETLRANRGVDPDAQLRAAREIESNLAEYGRLLAWNGFPTYDQRVATCDILMRFLSGRPQGPATPESVALRVDRVRRFSASVPALAREQIRFSRSSDEAIDEVVYFIRNYVGFTFPFLLGALERIQNEVLGRAGLRSGSYSFYAAQAEAYFLPQYFSVLEEYGLPYQLALKLAPFGLGGGSLDEVLESLRFLAAIPANMELRRYEREMLSDVAIGLG